MTDLIFAGICSGIIIAAVSGSMVLFRNLFPAGKSHPIVGRLDVPELDERFLPLKWKVWGAMVFVLIAFGFLSWKALSSLNLFLASQDQPVEILLLPQSAIWWFFPGLGALSLCWELTLQLWALLWGREKVNLFSNWTNQSTKFWGGGGQYSGMDSRKVLRWMTALIAFPIGVFTVLALNMHASVGPDTIRDCGYAFMPCKVYPLADVRRVTEIKGYRTRDGELTPRAGLVLDFKDGRRWLSAEWGDPRPSIDRSLEDFILRKTNLTLGYADTEKEIPSVMER